MNYVLKSCIHLTTQPFLCLCFVLFSQPKGEKIPPKQTSEISISVNRVYVHFTNCFHFTNPFDFISLMTDFYLTMCVLLDIRSLHCPSPFLFYACIQQMAGQTLWSGLLLLLFDLSTLFYLSFFLYLILSSFHPSDDCHG